MIAKMYNKGANGKVAGGKGGGDLHEKKDSHVSFPADAKIEFHLRSDDLGEKCEVGENYTVMIPMVCTSIDDEATRLRQIGKPAIKELQKNG